MFFFFSVFFLSNQCRLESNRGIFYLDEFCDIKSASRTYYELETKKFRITQLPSSLIHGYYYSDGISNAVSFRLVEMWVSMIKRISFSCGQ